MFNFNVSVHEAKTSTDPTHKNRLSLRHPSVSAIPTCLAGGHRHLSFKMNGALRTVWLHRYPCGFLYCNIAILQLYLKCICNIQNHLINSLYSRTN
uniref:Uncharacterized protein n=1 Tax=Anguilla anguilla TaxID=7936 RepID=A0A0E9W9U6_ANGAN